jgi:hypothetical protein
MCEHALSITGTAYANSTSKIILSMTGVLEVNKHGTEVHHKE